MGDWPICDDGSGKHGHQRPYGALSPTPMHASEATVVYRHPATGKVRYPPRNDQPMPERYRQQGYERVTLPTLRSVDRFCADNGVVNEKAHFDSNGKGVDVNG